MSRVGLLLIVAGVVTVLLLIAGIGFAACSSDEVEPTAEPFETRTPTPLPPTEAPTSTAVPPTNTATATPLPSDCDYGIDSEADGYKHSGSSDGYASPSDCDAGTCASHGYASSSDCGADFYANSSDVDSRANSDIDSGTGGLPGRFFGLGCSGSGG